MYPQHPGNINALCNHSWLLDNLRMRNYIMCHHGTYICATCFYLCNSVHDCGILWDTVGYCRYCVPWNESSQVVNAGAEMDRTGFRCSDVPVNSSLLGAQGSSRTAWSPRVPHLTRRGHKGAATCHGSFSQFFYWPTHQTLSNNSYNFLYNII
jgi:hypothetical protein